MAGNKEYMIRYFLGERFPDMGWGQFGNEVEDCVTTGNCEPFDDEEMIIPRDVKPLGIFQDEIVVDFETSVFLVISMTEQRRMGL